MYVVDWIGIILASASLQSVMSRKLRKAELKTELSSFCMVSWEQIIYKLLPKLNLNWIQEFIITEVIDSEDVLVLSWSQASKPNVIRHWQTIVWLSTPEQTTITESTLKVTTTKVRAQTNLEMGYTHFLNKETEQLGIEQLETGSTRIQLRVIFMIFIWVMWKR